MNIFEQYGIKEVADVCLYSIELDENDDEIYVPVLYFDTLKISTFSQTAEQTSARGGLGNPHLIVWDFGKEITVELEDALFSPASQSIAWGGKMSSRHFELSGGFTREDEETRQAKVQILNYSEVFSYSNSWAWDCNIAIKTTDNTVNLVKKVKLYCAKDTVNNSYFWQFEGGRSAINFPEGVLTVNKIQRNISPQEFMYIIDHSIQNVKYLERLEKCKASHTFAIDTKNNMLHSQYSHLEKYAHSELTVFLDPKTMQPYEPNAEKFKRQNGTTITGDLRIIKQHDIYYKWKREKAPEFTSLGNQIVVDPIHFPGTYRLVGETYVRSRNTGKDQRYQIEIPLCKMSANNSITLQADGEPTTFDFSLQVLRKEDNTMMKLTQYDVTHAIYDGVESGSTIIVPESPLPEPQPPEEAEVTIEWLADFYGEREIEQTASHIEIESPNGEEIYVINDELNKTDGSTQSDKYDIVVALYYDATITGRKGTRKFVNGTPTDEWKTDENGEVIVTEVVTEEVKDYAKVYLDSDEYSIEITDGGV